MFDSPEFPQSLEEDVFDAWLEKGRESPIAYEFMLVIWDEAEDCYYPAYAENRQDVLEKNPGFWGESVRHASTVAVYDLFSEAKMSFGVFEN